jgi:HD domain.
MKNRVEILRGFLDDLMMNKQRGELWFVERYMFAVSNFAAMIALKRNLNPEIAAMIGLLHDIHT